MGSHCSSHTWWVSVVYQEREEWLEVQSWGRAWCYPRLMFVPNMINWVQNRMVSLETITPDKHCHVSSQGILPKDCLCRREWIQLRGLYGVPLHLVFQHLNPGHIGGSTVIQVVACQDECSYLCQQLAVLVPCQWTVTERVKRDVTWKLSTIICTSPSAVIGCSRVLHSCVYFACAEDFLNLVSSS